LAPERPVVVLDGDDRPQPGIDREEGRGMAVTVGRIRRCDVHHVKFMVLSHNLIRGAAGAAVLNAELCRARGLVPSPGASGRPPAGAAGAADVAGSVGRPGGNGA
ncbi:MAG: Asd/ArgC dimerization domain-containing protein, partial [Gemmatimonadota bacterium]